MHNVVLGVVIGVADQKHDFGIHGPCLKIRSTQ